MDIDQSVETGSAIFAQSGDGNILNISQQGFVDNFTVNATQMGVANHANITQGSELNGASEVSTQSGNNNAATITQR